MFSTIILALLAGSAISFIGTLSLIGVDSIVKENKADKNFVSEPVNRKIIIL